MIRYGQRPKKGTEVSIELPDIRDEIGRDKGGECEPRKLRAQECYVADTETPTQTVHLATFFSHKCGLKAPDAQQKTLRHSNQEMQQ
eukprot:2855812-Amphidinium_carterae.1